MDSCHAAWQLGARFKFLHHDSPRFAHRIYWGPPDGTRRNHIKPKEVFVDFGAEYTVNALYIGKEFSAVQFQVEPEGVFVWTNIRRGYAAWWAAISEAQPSTRPLTATALRRSDALEAQTQAGARPYGPGMLQCLEEGRAPVEGEPVKKNEDDTQKQGVWGDEEQDGDDKAPVNEDPGVPVNEEQDGDDKAPVKEDQEMPVNEDANSSKRQRSV